MGSTSYSHENRSVRASVSGFATNSINDNFTQNKKRCIHPEMDPNGVTLREARDSDVHPYTFPIIIALDLTGSMQNIPQNLIIDGLPKIVSSLQQAGIESPAILFMGVGDHEWDNAPLQIGQFESGDKELDLWLTRTFLEGGGGGNAGESYSLAHFFAARYCETDHFEARKQKGVLITIGDEPNLRNYPTRALGTIMGNNNIPTVTDDELLEEAKEKWEVFHVNPRSHSYRNPDVYWKAFLGQNYFKLDSANEIPNKLSEIIINVYASQERENTPTKEETIIDMNDTLLDEEEEEIL